MIRAYCFLAGLCWLAAGQVGVAIPFLVIGVFLFL